MTEKLQQQFDEVTGFACSSPRASPESLGSEFCHVQASRLVEEHAHKNAGADIAEAMQQLRAVRKASKLQRDEDQ